MTITCPAGIIFIETAIYGRTEDDSVCPDPAIKDTYNKCTSTESQAIIKSKCDGKSECRINVVNYELGGDPCPGTYKYLEVNFKCY